MITVSLNEVETTTLKAARGAGRAWGIAEEAGLACRWLALHGLPFAAPLLATLSASASSRTAFDLGIACVDDAIGLPRRCPLLPGAVVAPVLLVPFVARVARRTGQPLIVRWAGFSAVTASHSFAISLRDGLGAAIANPSIDHANGQPVPEFHEIGAITSGAAVDVVSWQSLQSLAERTYVPESAASRARGAGGGLTDAD